MAVGDAYVFPGFLTPVLTQLFFPKPPTTFLTCFSRGERRNYAGKKSRLNRGSNSQPPGHESDTLTIEPPAWGNFSKSEDVLHCNASRYRQIWKTRLRKLSIMHGEYGPCKTRLRTFLRMVDESCCQRNNT